MPEYLRKRFGGQRIREEKKKILDASITQLTYLDFLAAMCWYSQITCPSRFDLFSRERLKLV
jgi:hypothetical protein